MLAFRDLTQLSEHLPDIRDVLPSATVSFIRPKPVRSHDFVFRPTLINEVWLIVREPYYKYLELQSMVNHV